MLGDDGLTNFAIYSTLMSTKNLSYTYIYYTGHVPLRLQWSKQLLATINKNFGIYNPLMSTKHLSVIYIYLLYRSCSAAASKVEAVAGHDQQELWNPCLLPTLARQDRGIEVGITGQQRVANPHLLKITLKLYYKILLQIFP